MKRHLQGRPTGAARVWLQATEASLSVDVEATAGGWQIRVPERDQPHLSSRSDVLQGLERVVGWDQATTRDLVSGHDPAWVWIPAKAVKGILWHPHIPASGVNYLAKARDAWLILHARMLSGDVITYGDLGHTLGGLHPLHDVPQVLDIIQRWCREHGEPDLTGLVVSQRTRMPGRDYWRQNGWIDLPPEQQATLWQESVAALKSCKLPEKCPF